MHLEQIRSGRNQSVHPDKRFSELYTGQRGVSGRAIIPTISYNSLVPQGACCKFGFFSSTPLNLKIIEKPNSERTDYIKEKESIDTPIGQLVILTKFSLNNVSLTHTPA